MKQQFSQGVSNLLQRIVSPNDVILDLGSFASGTTQAFLKKRCHCYVEDLPLFLNELKIHDDFDFKQALKQHLVILNDEVKIDKILAWDLFHYLSLEEIEVLFSLIADKLKPGTVIHTTRHTGTKMPDKPKLFKLLDDFSYQMIEPKSNKKISNHSHTTIDLLKHLKHFHLRETYTHKDSSNKGLVEYALIYDERGTVSLARSNKVKPSSVDFADIITTDKFDYLKLPNLSKLFNEYSEKNAHCILDCSGSMVSNFRNLEALSNMVLEEDLHRSMLWQEKLAVGASGSLHEQILDYHDSVKFDLVLMWDLMNFFNQQQITGLVEKVSKHLKTSSLIHLVMPYSGGLADKPGNYRISKDHQVEMHGNLSKETAQKLLTTSELVRLLPNFKVLSYYFGTQPTGENYQEYLFEFLG